MSVHGRFDERGARSRPRVALPFFWGGLDHLVHPREDIALVKHGLEFVGEHGPDVRPGLGHLGAIRRPGGGFNVDERCLGDEIDAVASRSCASSRDCGIKRTMRLRHVGLDE